MSLVSHDIFIRISEMYAQLTKSEKKVADYVKTNPKDILYSSITDLAEKCGVGDTTVFRFCKTLKLNGYQDFRVSVAQAVAGQNGQDSLVGDIELGDDVESICKKALFTNIAALNETYSLIDFHAVERAVELIAGAKRIHFFGMGSSSVTALEAKQKFMRILPNVEFVADSHMQYMAASLMGREDLAVVFSYSGSTKDIIEILNIAKKNGSKSVCITRFAKSPLTQLTDVTLLCGSNEGPLQGGSLSTMLTQLYVLDVLYLLYFIQHYDRAKDNKSKTTEAISAKLL